MLIVKHKERNIKITYRNDVIFKLTLGGCDQESEEILKFIVKAVTNKEYENLEVTNINVLGNSHKRNILDIKAIDKQGYISYIKIHQSDISEMDLKRFQSHTYRLIGNQLESEEDVLKSVDQIVFTTGQFNEQLLSVYKQREQTGKEMHNNLASFYLISLPYIEEMMKRKKQAKEKLTNLEVISYIYYKDIDDELINMLDDKQKRIVEYMNKKFEYAINNEIIFEEVKKAAYQESWICGYINRYKEQGLKEGISIMINSYSLDMFNEDISMWIKELTDEQLMMVKENIYKVKNIEELKLLI